MATAIKAIPTLYGEEDRRFQEMANAVIRHLGFRAFSSHFTTKLVKFGHSCNSIKKNCTQTVNDSYRILQVGNTVQNTKIEK